MRRDRYGDRQFRRVCERVVMALESKWRVASSEEDPLAPWVLLHEVVESTGLTQFDARRALHHLSTREPFLVRYDPADKASRTPAKWVLLRPGEGSRLLDFGNGSAPSTADDGLLRHITSEYA